MLNGKVKIKLTGINGYLQLKGVYYSANFTGSQGLLLEALLMQLEAFYQNVYCKVQIGYVSKQAWFSNIA